MLQNVIPSGATELNEHFNHQLGDYIEVEIQPETGENTVDIDYMTVEACSERPSGKSVYNSWMFFDIIPELSNPDKISCEHVENKACKALVVLDLSLRCLDHVDCVIILAYTFIFSFWMQTKMFLLLNQPPERFDNYLFCKLWCLRAGMLPRFDIRHSCRKKNIFL